MERYYITNKIGEGGFGECYLIETKKEVLKQERLVAKVVNMSGMNDAEKEKSIQEIKILNVIHHSNLVSLVESYATKNLLCIIMELGEYGSLEGEIEARSKGERKDNNYFAEDEIMFIFLQILLGVGYLHENNIVHCDIKTSNVILFSNGIVKLSDFGVSNVISSKSDLESTQAVSGPGIQGSIYYLAPEIYLNMAPDKRSDYWSIGCLLLELCSLEKLFRRFTVDELVIFSVNNQAKFSKEVKSHSETFGVDKRYSKELNKIIFGLLNPNPDDRVTINHLLNSNEYVLNYIQRFLNTINAKKWTQFLYINQINNWKRMDFGKNGKVDILKLPFWVRNPVDVESQDSRFFFKQDLDEWFKSQEKLLHNYSESKSSLIPERNIKSHGKEDESTKNKYKEIIEYFNQKEKRKDIQNQTKLSRRDILLQLETTVEFFVTQLSAINSKKVTTEEIIRRNLANKLTGSRLKAPLSRKDTLKGSQKLKSTSLIRKTNSNSSLKRELRNKYDKEREQLREIMRKGRAEAKIKNRNNFSVQGDFDTSS
ncbi:protein kinase [Cryptosporidium felis]|nr:protein kinase [Cryptosporidium felis]